jgi:hypothetical protein
MEGRLAGLVQPASVAQPPCIRQPAAAASPEQFRFRPVEFLARDQARLKPANLKSGHSTGRARRRTARPRPVRHRHPPPWPRGRQLPTSPRRAGRRTGKPAFRAIATAARRGGATTSPCDVVRAGDDQCPGLVDRLGALRAGGAACRAALRPPGRRADALRRRAPPASSAPASAARAAASVGARCRTRTRHLVHAMSPGSVAILPMTSGVVVGASLTPARSVPMGPESRPPPTAAFI